MSGEEYVIVGGRRYPAFAGIGVTASDGTPGIASMPYRNTAEVFTPVTPTIHTNAGGTTAAGSSVVINSGAGAGSRHVEDASPTEAEAMLELVGFVFPLADQVKYAALSLSVEGLGDSEVQALKFVVNGDVISDATALQNENDVSWVLRNETVEITAGRTSFITRVGCLAANSAIATAVATGARIFCMGYK